MKILLKLVIDMILTFAYSGDEEIDPDFAVSQLEWISATLKELDADTLRSFLDQVSEEGDRAEQSGNESRAQQLREMIDHLGLT